MTPAAVVEFFLSVVSNVLPLAFLLVFTFTAYCALEHWGLLPRERKSFSHAVSSAAEAVASEKPLTRDTLHALLEDGTRTMLPLGDTGAEYAELELEWRRIGTVACREEPVTHEVSQHFDWRLPDGSIRSYRFHRFLFPQSSHSQLTEAALKRAKVRLPEDSVELSNLGGYQSPADLFCGQHEYAKELYDDKGRCALEAAIVDGQQSKGSLDIDRTALLSQLPESWVNVSESSALNELHTHGIAPFSSIFYTQVPQACGGELLFRLSPGTSRDISGGLLGEPDALTQVPWMLPSGTGSGSARLAAEDPSKTGVAYYAKVVPQPGMMLVFPGWIPHSVAPHFSLEARVSVAANWRVPTLPLSSASTVPAKEEQVLYV